MSCTICTTSLEIETRQRWQTAVNSIPAINALKLLYPNLWQHIYKKNSNTVFNTICKVMCFHTPALLLPTYAPGINLVISDEIINQYLYILHP